MIAKTVGDDCEVVLHDLENPQHSVVYTVNNCVTGRQVGQSFDHLVPQVILSKKLDHDVVTNYYFRTEDGRLVKSSTALLKDFAGKVVGALCTIAPELPFKLQFVELGENRETIELDPYVIRAFRVNHNVVCYGYSIEIPRGGRFDVERAKAQEIPQKFWSRLQKGETIEFEGRVLTPDMVLGPARRGLKVTYCTDTRPLPVIAEYAQGSDLFICEGMYGEKEKASKAKEYKHMTFYEAAALAKEAQPGQMWLTHYSPSLTRPEDYMDEVRKIFPRAKAARDGWTMELEFDED